MLVGDSQEQSDETTDRLGVLFSFPGSLFAADPDEQLFLDPIDVNVPHISTDKSVKYDYDIVYVRAPRAGRQGPQAVLHRLLRSR